MMIKFVFIHFPLFHIAIPTMMIIINIISPLIISVAIIRLLMVIGMISSFSLECIIAAAAAGGGGEASSSFIGIIA